MSQVREKITDKYDVLQIVGKPMSPTEVEAMFGTKQESQCTMTAA
jgi:hypothetical protein